MGLTTTQQTVAYITEFIVASILTGKRKYHNDHIYTIFREPGWLPINDMLPLRDITMVYKVLYGLALSYFQPMLVR